MFFSFDGIDGAGKSTQIEKFARWLEDLGLTVCRCRDPGSTGLGEKLRELLLDEAGLTIGSRAEMLIYMAARAQLVEEVIKPAVARGEVVISDRFLLANLVYQGYAGGVPLDAIRQAGAIAVDGANPDQVFVLDLPPDAALARLNRPFDRIESRGVEFLSRVREGFRSEAKNSPQQIAIVDARMSVEEVHQVCLDRAEPLVRAWLDTRSQPPKGRS